MTDDNGNSAGETFPLTALTVQLLMSVGSQFIKLSPTASLISREAVGTDWLIGRFIVGRIVISDLGMDVDISTVAR